MAFVTSNKLYIILMVSATEVVKEINKNKCVLQYIKHNTYHVHGLRCTVMLVFLHLYSI